MSLFDGEPGITNNAGCPTLAAFLSLRLGWETSKLNQPCSRSEHHESL